MDEQRSLEQPSVVSSVERMFEAGQRLLIERIDLARLEAQDAIARALRAAIFVMVGGTLAFTGWLALMACMIVALRDNVGLPAATSTVIVALVHAIGGGVLVAYGLRGSSSSQRSEGGS